MAILVILFTETVVLVEEHIKVKMIGMTNIR